MCFKLKAKHCAAEADGKVISFAAFGQKIGNFNFSQELKLWPADGTILNSKDH